VIDPISFAFSLLSADQLRQVVHNPGTVPDAEFGSPGPDFTTVVEESFERYKSAELQERLLRLPYTRERCSYMVHSVPKDDVRRLVGELRPRGEYLFVTDACENYYASFGTSWDEFIKAMKVE
jgi:hypothetical protein